MNNKSSPRQRNRRSLGQRGYLKLSRGLAIKLGINAAILMSELIDREEYLEMRGLIEIDQPFYTSQDYIQKQTGLSPYQQRWAMAELVKSGVLEVKRIGQPARNFYFISHEFLEDLLNDIPYYHTLEDDSQIVSSSLSRSRETKALSNTRESNEESKIQEELRSSSLIDSSSFNEEPVETVLKVSGLIKRKITSPIVFEKQPRQKYNVEAMDIINYWNSSPGLSHYHLPPIINGRVGEPTKTFTKTYETTQKVLNGKFFTSVGLSSEDRIYSKEEIIIAIDKFKLTATHPGFLPEDKKHLKTIKLDSFFYNPFSSYISSQFLKYLKEEPKPITSVVKREEEKNPQLTQWIKDIYIEKILLGEKKRFNNVEENKFIIGANHLHETMRRLQKRENMSTRPIEWCQMLVDSLVASWGRERIHPGHISSDYTYSDTLTRYLKSKGRID